jgi:ComF family protein
MALQDGRSQAVWKPRLTGAVRGLADLILPPRSLEGPELVQVTGLPAEAWGRVRFIDDPVCDGCGSPFEHAQADVRCAACLARPRVFARARAACLYDEASRDLILRLKHADRTDLTGLFAAWISRAAAELIAEADAVLPVPLHRWRLFRRRYNQSAEIARPLAARHGLRFLPDALQRPRARDSQAGKSAAGRRRNVQAAFEVPAARRAQVEGRRLLVVDDVMTTGATAEACARALLRAGAAAVDVAVIARVREMSIREISPR